VRIRTLEKLSRITFADAPKEIPNGADRHATTPSPATTLAGQVLNHPVPLKAFGLKMP